jgi:nucleoside-diphosphate-sugar epimerase
LAQANGIPHAAGVCCPQKSLPRIDLCKSWLTGKLFIPGEFFASRRPQLEHEEAPASYLPHYSYPLFPTGASMAKLIFGCGYLGLRVARRWLAGGEAVFAVTRSAERAGQLGAEGLKPIVADVTVTSQLALPPRIETVLWAVGHDKLTRRASEGAQSIYDVFVGGLETAIRGLPPAVKRFIYISSTGVYGQVTGEEVDEDSPCQPTREGGKACLAAEELLRASPLADRSIILRLAGLYGPNRIPRNKDLLAGTPIDAPSKGWLNLIHVEDAARIVVLAEQRAKPPKLYVVSDGQPVIRAEYYRELARLLDSPPPRFIEPGADTPAAARASSDKRASPRRLFAELSPILQYPSYREGLAHAVASTQFKLTSSGSAGPTKPS